MTKASHLGFMRAQSKDLLGTNDGVYDDDDFRYTVKYNTAVEDVKPLMVEIRNDGEDI